jgi:hypothetical protein
MAQHVRIARVSDRHVGATDALEGKIHVIRLQSNLLHVSRNDRIF